MSMQRIVNYGSFLQAYALKSEIEKLGHEVEFVDYKVCEPIAEPPHLIHHKEENALKIYLRRFYHYLKGQKKDFREIYRDSLKKIGVKEKRKYNTEVDTLVIGSDEVFNCLQNNGDVGYSLELFGKNNKAKKLISYGASFGFTTYEGLLKYGKYEEIKELINKFDEISVRDENSFELIEKMTSKKPSVHVDPVIIHDFSDKIIEKNDLKDYIIVYSYAGRIKDNEIKEIKDFAKKHNKKIVSIGFHQEFCDIKINCTPFEMLGYFKNAFCIITDTFHGTIFSVKTRNNFATIIRDSNRQKLTTLLKILGLSEKSVKNSIEEALNINIDYKKVEEKIKKEREKSINYLKKNI